MTTKGKMAQQQYNDKNSSACSYRLLMIVSLFGFLLDYTAQAASPSTPSSAAAESKRNYLIARARISKDRDNESRPTVIYPRGGAGAGAAASTTTAAATGAAAGTVARASRHLWYRYLVRFSHTF